MKKIIVIGGGTTNPVANHLAITAPAFGSTAKKIANKLPTVDGFEVVTVLTKMADSNSKILSNKDLMEYVDELLKDINVKVIIFNVAVADFEVKYGDFHGERLSSKHPITLNLTPSEKIIGKIRTERPDIFLVGFKTTTNKTIDEQFFIGLERMKKNKCNLMFCNDTITRMNFVITPEETMYGHTTDRDKALDTLVELLGKRMFGTYNKTKLIKTSSFVESELDTFLTNNKEASNIQYFKDSIKRLINEGAFVSNNGNDFTPGHFCFRLPYNVARELLDGSRGICLDSFVDENETLGFAFLSSQRKMNHNIVFSEGMCLVIPLKNGDSIAFGNKKPSVGARTQAMLLKEFKDANVIIHTHNPINPNGNGIYETREQFNFQCGSLECGNNTLSGLVWDETTKNSAVYLEKHGFNYVSKIESYSDSTKVVEFFKENTFINLKVK